LQLRNRFTSARLMVRSVVTTGFAMVRNVRLSIRGAAA
jgi:hypothetical protein